MLERSVPQRRHTSVPPGKQRDGRTCASTHAGSRLAALGLTVMVLAGVAGCSARGAGATPASRHTGKTAPVRPENRHAGFAPITEAALVPDVVGENYGTAQVRLATTGRLGLQAAYRLVHDPTVPAGRVVEESPGAGAAVSSSDVVTLLVSEGPARVPGATACTSADLRARDGPSVSEATGQHTLDITLQNVSRSTCVLEGHPAVRMLDSHGRRLAFHYTHRGDQMTTGATARPVYLPPGADAWVRLNKYRCDIAATDYAATVVLGLPRGGGAIVFVLPASSRDDYFSDCRETASSTVAVSPFEPVSLLLGQPLPSP